MIFIYIKSSRHTIGVRAGLMLCYVMLMFYHQYVREHSYNLILPNFILNWVKGQDQDVVFYTGLVTDCVHEK